MGRPTYDARPSKTLWPFVLTHSLGHAESTAQLEFPGLDPNSEVFRKRVRDLLKTPEQAGWPDAPPESYEAAAFRALRERRNIGLLLFRVNLERPDLRLVCFDIDSQDARTLAFADYCGSRGAMAYKTGRGVHIWTRVAPGCGDLQQFGSQLESILFEGVEYSGRIEVFATARKLIVLPIEGTPRGDECEFLWLAGIGKASGFGVTLGGFLALLEGLRFCEVTPGEPEPQGDVRAFVRVSAGKWVRLFGRQWKVAPLSEIVDRVRYAQYGERNVTLYEAAKVLGFRGFAFDEVERDLLEAAREVFRYGDAEYAGGTYNGARGAIRRGWTAGQRFAAQLGTTDPDEVPRRRTTTALQLLERLQREGALYYDDAGRPTVLHRGQAAPVSRLAEYCAARFGATLSRHQADTLEHSAASLPKPLALGLRVVIVQDYVTNYNDSDWVGLFVVHVQGDSIAEALEHARELEVVSEQVANELASFCAQQGFLRPYVLEARYEPAPEGGGVLRLYGHPTEALPPGVYVPWDLPWQRTLNFADFLRWLAITCGIEHRTPESPEVFAGVARAVVESKSFGLTVTTLQRLPVSDLAEYLISWSEFHSNSTFRRYLKSRETSAADYLYLRQTLMARTAALLAPTALSTGVLLVTGEPGTGKTTLGYRLSYAVNGQLASLGATTDTRSAEAAASQRRLLFFEEAGRVPAELQSYVKSIVTGVGTLRRALYSNEQLLRWRERPVSAVFTTAHEPALDPDMARRLVVWRMERPEVYASFHALGQAIEHIAGLDGIYLALLSALVHATGFDEVPREWRGWNRGLVDLGRIAQHAWPEWVLSESMPDLARTYIALTRAFGVPDEVAEGVWTAVRNPSAQYTLGVWEYVVECANLDASFAADLANGMPASQIADRLHERGYLRELSRTQLAQRLGRTWDAVREPLRRAGWESRSTKPGGVSHYALWRAGQSAAGTASEATDLEAEVGF